MKRLFTLFFFTFFVANAQFKVKHYNTLNSELPHDLCYGIVQDENGFIWVGTDDGLARFNGQYFKNYTINNGLLSNYIIDLEKISNDSIAIVSWGGGLQFKVNDSFKNIGEKIKLHKVQKYKSGFFTKGSKYILYHKNNNHELQFKYYNENKTEVVFTKKQTSFPHSFPDFEVIDNELYFFNDFNQEVPFKGIYKLEENQLKKSFQFLNNYCVSGIVKINDNYYCSISNDKILFFNKNQILEIKELPIENYKIKKVVNKNNILIFIVQDNLTRYNKIAITNTQLENPYIVESSVINNQLISDVLIDNENNIWISSYGAGLFKFYKEEHYIADKKIKGDNILDIKEYKEKIYFNSSHKIYHLDKRVDKIDSIFTDIELWKFAQNNSNEIFVFNRVHKTKKTKIIDNIFITEQLPTKLYSHSFNVVFVEAYITIFKNNYQKKYILKDKIRKGIIKDDLVYLSTTNGLYIYNTVTSRFKILFKAKEAVPNNDIKDMFFEGETLWLASSKGLYSFSNNRLVNHIQSDELLDAAINSVCLDHHNVIWIATQKGFSIFKNGKFYNFFYKKNDISSFTQKIYEDKEHNIWILGNKGVLKIDNTKQFLPRKKPFLYIKQNATFFEIDAISFFEIDLIKEYKLNNGNWIKLTEPILDFKNYKNGNYNLQFRARLLNSNWTYSKKHTFSIIPPWYEQTWSYVLFVFLSGLIVIMIIFLRYRKTQKRNLFLTEIITKNELLQKELSEVRENVAQDFHDELGNKLAGITVVSGMMLEDEGFKKTDWFKQLDRINKDAQDLYFGIKDFIWSIDSKNDDINELLFYLKDFGEELFANTTIKFDIKTNIDHENYKLPYYWSRQLLLLFKEAMTNTLKYSNATNCLLEIKLKDKTLQIIFSDNGKGFDLETLKRKNGLLNMQKRASKIKGQLLIESNNGTQIKFIGKKLI